MKVAILSESSADEAAVRILVDGIRGAATEPVGLHRFAVRQGWTAVVRILPAVLKDLYYGTAADALVVIVDSDKSPIHEPAHDQAGGSHRKCRLCFLRKIVQQTQGKMRKVPGRAPLKTALGLAVPQIEA